MTSKEKAEELVHDYYSNIMDIDFDDARQCALIAVDEILETLNEDIKDINVVGNVLLDLIEYWQDVEKEIEKL